MRRRSWFKSFRGHTPKHFNAHFSLSTNGPGGAYERSDWSRIRAFADIIYKAGYASPIRTPRGEDIMAACGQLKSATVRVRKSRTETAGDLARG